MSFCLSAAPFKASIFFALSALNQMVSQESLMNIYARVLVNNGAHMLGHSSQTLGDFLRTGLGVEGVLKRKVLRT